MQPLYKINQELISLVERADPETGVIDEQAFEALTLEKEEKQLNIARFIKHLDNDLYVIEKEAKRIADLKRITEARQEWLKSYLQKSMELDGKKEIDFTLFKARIKQNPPSVNIFNEDCILSKYWVVKEVRSFDKKLIKEDLKNGIIVEGAELVTKERLEVK